MFGLILPFQGKGFCSTCWLLDGLMYSYALREPVFKAVFMKKINLIFLLFFALMARPLIAQDLYALDQITQIELKFFEEDWQYPLHYLHAQKKGGRNRGKALINGQVFDSVGVRFKGFSSYNRKQPKNPLNIKLDYVDKNAHYQGYETLKLSNGNLDPSWLREVLAYQIARKYMVAPQSNYAKVYVNGSYHGLFGNTENVDGNFAKRYFGTSKNKVLIKGNSPLGPFAGERSSLVFLGNDSSAYQKAYELESSYGWKSLVELTRTLKHSPEKIETLLDMDAAIWMLAFNNVLVNLDSYSDFQQNYYLVQDDNGRFHFVLWDVNLAFDGLGKTNGATIQPDYNPLAHENDDRFPLIKLVLKNPFYRKVYFAHCRTILNENFANGWYKAEAEKHRQLIAEAVRQDSNWSFDYSAFEQNFHQTYVQQKPAPFPFPGITELMEARLAFLQKHPEYRKTPPSISAVNATAAEDRPGQVAITATVKNAQKASLLHRSSPNGIFKKTSLFDDGLHGDGAAADGVFAALIPLEGYEIQYYILAENKEAIMFSPEAAEHVYYTFKK
jgi:hypothetical protein